MITDLIKLRMYALGLILLLAIGGCKKEPALVENNPVSSSPQTPFAVGSDRVALLIGNSEYHSEDGYLGNPANDAVDYAAALRGIGFETKVMTNLNKDEFVDAVEKYAKQIESVKGIALFYYAGHGAAVNGVNYLLPIGKPYQNSQSRVVNFGIDANWVVQRLGESSQRVNLMIVDACRNSPLNRGMRGGVNSAGLERMQAPSGSLIAFATSFGSPARDGTGQRNSPYAKHLISALSMPELTVTDYFNAVRDGVERDTQNEQRPEETSRLKGLSPMLRRTVAKTTLMPKAIAGEEIGGRSQPIKFGSLWYKRAGRTGMLKITKVNDEMANVDIAESDGGCSATIEGVARIVENELRLTVPVPGESKNCSIAIKFSDDEAVVDEGNNCLSFHGAGCGFGALPFTVHGGISKREQARPDVVLADAKIKEGMYPHALLANVAFGKKYIELVRPYLAKEAWLETMGVAGPVVFLGSNDRSKKYVYFTSGKPHDAACNRVSGIFDSVDPQNLQLAIHFGRKKVQVPILNETATAVEKEMARLLSSIGAKDAPNYADCGTD